MRLVFTVREGANPELYADLEGRDSRARPERVRYLATLGLLVSQGRIEAAEGAAAGGGVGPPPSPSPRAAQADNHQAVPEGEDNPPSAPGEETASPPTAQADVAAGQEGGSSGPQATEDAASAPPEGLEVAARFRQGFIGGG